MTTNKMTVNGVSVCATGEERYDRFVAGAFRGTEYYQYDYRHADGELFSIVCPSLEKCREERDKWLKNKLSNSKKQQYDND